MDENPVVRQVANVVTTIAFFALIAFLAHSHSISEQSIAWILGAFTVGTSGVKLTRHVTGGLSQRMRAVRSSSSFPPPSDEGGGGGGAHAHSAITRPIERQGGPGPYGREGGKGPGGIIRRLIVAWGPTVLAGTLSAVLFVLSREPVAMAAPQDPPTMRP